MTLTHPEPGFQGYRSFPSPIAHKSREIYHTKRTFYQPGDYRPDTMLETRKLDNINPQRYTKDADCKPMRPLYVTDTRCVRRTFWKRVCRSIYTGWAKKTGLFLEVCNSRIC